MNSSKVRLAVIDVGTLKSKFEIRDYRSPDQYSVVYKDKKLTVLGRDLPKTNGMIIDSAIKTTIEALNEFKLKMKELAVKTHLAVTTEAVRNAKNSEAVLRRIKDETGLKLIVLSHQDEAEIFFKHVANSFNNKRVAVADIGGGSVQVVIGKGSTIEYVHLFKTGTYFMQETFFKTHKPEKNELLAAQNYVKQEFKSLRDLGLVVDELVYGSTNIIDFMKAVNIKLKKSNYTDPHPYRSHINELKSVYEKISPMKYEDRMELFPEEPYYMWSADNALVNIIEMAEILNLDSVIPTNENISSGLFRQLYRQSLIV